MSDAIEGGADAHVVRMVAVEVGEGTTKSLAGVDAENDRGHLIDVGDDALGIDENDAVLDAFDNSFGLGLFVDDAIDVELLELLESFGHPVEFDGNILELSERLLAETAGRAVETEAAQVFG
jgi:hypothetical protein